MTDSQHGRGGIWTGVVLVAVFIGLGAWGALYSQFQTLSATVASQQAANTELIAKIDGLKTLVELERKKNRFQTRRHLPEVGEKGRGGIIHGL